MVSGSLLPSQRSGRGAGPTTHCCVRTLSQSSFLPQVSSVGVSSQHLLETSRAPTSPDPTPTTQSAAGWSWWLRVPPCCSPSMPSTWNTTTPVALTSWRSTTGLPQTRATCWGGSAARCPRHPSPPPGTSCLSSSTRISTWPAVAFLQAIRKARGTWQWRGWVVPGWRSGKSSGTRLRLAGSQHLSRWAAPS